MFALYAIYLQSKAVGLAFGKTLDQCMKELNVPFSQQKAKENSIYDRVSKKQRPFASDIIQISIALKAPYWFHCIRPDDATYRLRRDWCLRYIKDMQPCAEKVALGFLLEPKYDQTFRVFDRSAIEQSSIVAAVAYAYSSMSCKTEGDLQLLKLCVDSAQKLPCSEVHQKTREAGYQFAIYNVRKDLLALKKTVQLRYKAAAVDPRKGAVRQAELEMEPWVDYLKEKKMWP